MQCYRRLHQQHPEREFYFVHTSREDLDIHETRWVGLWRGNAVSVATIVSPFITVSITYCGAGLEIPNVLVDTGSAGTLLATDMLAKIGIVPEPYDTLVKVYGVGGAESVFARRMDRLQVGDQTVGRS